MSRAEGSKGGTGSKRDSEAQEAMPVAAPEDSQHAYIVREAVPRVSEDQKLYDSGEPADSAGALEVRSLLLVECTPLGVQRCIALLICATVKVLFEPTIKFVNSKLTPSFGIGQRGLYLVNT